MVDVGQEISIGRYFQNKLDIGISKTLFVCKFGIFNMTGKIYPDGFELDEPSIKLGKVEYVVYQLKQQIVVVGNNIGEHFLFLWVVSFAQ